VLQFDTGLRCRSTDGEIGEIGETGETGETGEIGEIEDEMRCEEV
jgi:hypothetical protein